MPEKMLGMSRIIISNERVSKLLCQNVMEKPCENWRYLQYLLIKNGYVIINRFDAEDRGQKTGGGNEAKISARLTARIKKTENFHILSKVDPQCTKLC
jgi:hypothetical protein